MPTALTRSRIVPRWFPFSAPRANAGSPKNRAVCLIPGVVFVVALVLAGCLYVRFLSVHRSLWDNPLHDRNAHYLYSLKLATDVRDGKVSQLLADLNESRVWPPLHGMLAASVMLIGGLDYRLAVLPSVAGWVIAVLFAFLTARRAVGRGGTLAGLVAAFFLMASPAHRAFATDIMLESLGAALSLVVLYAYLVAVQGSEDESWKGRCLGLALSLLFLEKYNYWLLVFLALTASEFAARPRFLLRWIGDTLATVPWRRWLSAQRRRPLAYGLAALLFLIGVVLWRGDRPFVWGERLISLYPPHNLIHVAYILVFLRLAVWWWRSGRLWARQLDGRLRQVILWHLCPMAVWFLLPKHLSYFLWYLSPDNAAPQQSLDLLAGIRQYGAWLVEDYHLDVRSTLMAACLCASCALSWNRLRPGGRGVLLFVLLAVALTVAHPNQKSRNLHSWMPAVWVAAGMGAAVLVNCMGTRLTPWLTGLVLAGLGWMQYPAAIAVGHAPEGGPHPSHPSLLDATDAYLPELDGARRTLILTAVPLKPMVQWTYLERYGRFDRLEERWYGFGAAGEENRRGFADWLRTTDCDTLIYCDKTTPKNWPDAGPECQLHAELKDILETQCVFHLEKIRDVPHYACRVQVWRRSVPGERARRSHE